jgi:hypothetical protein
VVDFLDELADLVGVLGEDAAASILERVPNRRT